MDYIEVQKNNLGPLLITTILFYKKYIMSIFMREKYHLNQPTIIDKDSISGEKYF
jgi:hypothetical protein